MKNLKPAAVLIPLLLPAQKESDLQHLSLSSSTDALIRIPTNTELLLTVRTHTVEHHKGQISFPGGIYESTDLSLRDTALRETQEEVGISQDRIEIISELPPIPTFSSQFEVTAFVGLIKEKPRFQPNPGEIQELLQVPLSHLLSPENSKLEFHERNGVRIQTRAYYFNSHRIWGVTGYLIQLFIQKLEKNSDP